MHVYSYFEGYRTVQGTVGTSATNGRSDNCRGYIHSRRRGEAERVRHSQRELSLYCTFVVLSLPLVLCALEIKQSAVTHFNGDDKANATFVWTAPPNSTGTVTFLLVFSVY